MATSLWEKKLSNVCTTENGATPSQSASVSEFCVLSVVTRLLFVAVDCGYPPEPNEYSKVHYTGTILHSMATYSCKHGYKLVGSKTVKCMYFGKWSDNAPVCKRESLHK